MNCKQAKKYISLLVDDELPAQQAGHVRQHILTCEECSVYYNQLLSIKTSLLTADTDVPRSFSARWRNSVHSTHPGKKIRMAKVFIPVAVAAVCGIFVISGLTGGLSAQSAEQTASYSAAANEYGLAQEEAAPEASEVSTLDGGTPAEAAPAPDAAAGAAEAEAADSTLESPPSTLVIDKTGELDMQAIISAAEQAGAGYSVQEGSITLTGEKAILEKVLAALSIEEPVTQDKITILCG